MFKAIMKAVNKNITKPTFPLFVSSNLQKAGFKTDFKTRYAYQLYPTHSLENRICPWTEVW